MTLDPRRTAVGAGCSYIKAKDPAFVAQLERWERAGLVAEWRTAHPHAVTAPGEWAPLPTSGEAGEASAWPPLGQLGPACPPSYLGLGLAPLGLAPLAWRWAALRAREPRSRELHSRPHAPWRRRPAAPPPRGPPRHCPPRRS